jgi:hypothetical protein
MGFESEDASGIGRGGNEASRKPQKLGISGERIVSSILSTDPFADVFFQIDDNFHSTILISEAPAASLISGH